MSLSPAHFLGSKNLPQTALILACLMTQAWGTDFDESNDPAQRRGCASSCAMLRVDMNEVMGRSLTTSPPAEATGTPRRMALADALSEVPGFENLNWLSWLQPMPFAQTNFGDFSKIWIILSVVAVLKKEPNLKFAALRSKVMEFKCITESPETFALIGKIRTQSKFGDGWELAPMFEEFSIIKDKLPSPSSSGRDPSLSPQQSATNPRHDPARPSDSRSSSSNPGTGSPPESPPLPPIEHLTLSLAKRISLNIEDILEILQGKINVTNSCKKAAFRREPSDFPDDGMEGPALPPPMNLPQHAPITHETDEPDALPRLLSTSTGGEDNPRTAPTSRRNSPRRATSTRTSEPLDGAKGTPPQGGPLPGSGGGVASEDYKETPPKRPLAAGTGTTVPGDEDSGGGV